MYTLRKLQGLLFYSLNLFETFLIKLQCAKAYCPILNNFIPYIKKNYLSTNTVIYHVIPNKRPIQHNTIQYHTIPYSYILYHTISYYNILCHTMTFFAILCHTLPYFALLFHTFTYYAILNHTLP